MKLLQIYVYTSHYRRPIYSLIDEEFDCEMVTAGNIKSNVKRMNLSLLHEKVTELKAFGLVKDLYYMKGMSSYASKDFDTYLITGEPKNISLWIFMIRKYLFHHHKRVFLWGHGLLGKESSTKKILYRLLFKMADGGFIYNERSVGLMKRQGIDSNKLYTIYNSLDYDAQLKIRCSIQPSDLYQEHFKNQNKNIVFIGRLTKIKRFDLLLEAVAHLRKKGEFVNVTFIGDGEEMANMERMVNLLNIQNQIWFYGACYDENNNAELIYNADLCVSPGNIGLTAIHVLMFGCPAITNNDFNHQMPEFEAIKNNQTGSFFEAGDSSSLAETISDWFKMHKDDREIIRKACYDEIDSKWNPHHQIEIFKRVLNS